MKKMLRWQGIVAFVVILGISFAAARYFAAPVIETAIESWGTQIAGAKVDVSGVELSTSPGRISIAKLEITDADSPMRNIIEVGEVEASIELTKLLMGQVIINDLNVAELALDTERKTSGFVAGLTDKKNNEGEESSSAAVRENAKELGETVKNNLPSTEELLAREPLLTIQRKEELEQSYQQRKQEWEKRKSELPTAEALKQYEKELKEIIEGKVTSLSNFETRKAQLKVLRKKISQDNKNLRSAKDFLVESRADLKSRLSALRAAPPIDIKNLKEKYGLDESGALNLVDLVFGEKVSKYLEAAKYWYEKLQPVLGLMGGEESAPSIPRGEGVFVRFYEEDPLPDFLIRESAISLLLNNQEGMTGELSIKANDLTHQPEVLNRPSRLHVNSKNLNGIESVLVNAVVDHRDGQKNDMAELSIVGMPLRDVVLSNDSSLAIQLPSAQLGVKGVVTFKDGLLKGDIVSSFTASQFSGEGNSTYAKEVIAALAHVDTFEIVASFEGGLDSLDYNLKSDLDQHLSDAFKARFKEKQKIWEGELKSGLEASVLSAISDSESLSGIIDTEEVAVLDSLNDVEELLKAKLDNFKEQKKGELKDKLKEESDSLKDKALGSADPKASIKNEKEDAKAKLAAEKAELERKKDEKREAAKDKLKSKMKDLF